MAFAPEALVERLGSVLGERARSVRHVLGQVVVELDPDKWVESFRLLKDDVELDLDFFSFLSAIDWSTEVSDEQKRAAIGGGPTPGGSFESREGADGYLAPEGDLVQLLVRLASAGEGHGVTIKADLDHGAPAIESLTSVYGGADWHERECHEMFGVEFRGHPNPRKLYLPDHFEGTPLRRSFVLGARLVKPWPGTVDVEDMPPTDEEEAPPAAEAETPTTEAPAEEAETPTAEAPAAEAPAVEAAPVEAAPVEAAPVPEPEPEPTAPEEVAEAETPDVADRVEERTSDETVTAPEPPPAAPTPEAATPESLEAESFRTGIPIAILQRTRQRTAAAPAAPSATSPAPPPASTPEVGTDSGSPDSQQRSQPEAAAATTAAAATATEAEPAGDGEESLEAESQRTGIPVSILKRSREARKKAQGS